MMEQLESTHGGQCAGDQQRQGEGGMVKVGSQVRGIARTPRQTRKKLELTRRLPMSDKTLTIKP